MGLNLPVVKLMSFYKYFRGKINTSRCIKSEVKNIDIMKGGLPSCLDGARPEGKYYEWEGDPA